MTVLMLVGAFCFSVFIAFCIENMHIFDMSKRKQKICALLSVVISAIVVTVRELLGLGGWTIAILTISLLIILWIVIYRNFLKVIMLTVYITAIYFGIESMYSLICVLFGRIPAVFLEYPEPTDIVIIAICWIVVILSSIFVKKPLEKHIGMNMINNRAMYFMAISACISLTFIFLNFAVDDALFTLGRQEVNLGYIAYFLFFVSSIIMFVIILRYISKETAQRTEKLFIESSKKYIHDLEESYKVLRTIKHDYVNILTSLKLHIDTGDMESLEKYYYGELSEINKDLLYQDQLMGSLQNVTINEIKSILIYKGSTAAGYDMDTSIEVRELIDRLGVSTAIVCQILGILLDNAIEAAIQTNEKKLYMAIIKNPESKTFIIKNSWQKQELSLNRLFELGFSTKAGNRGVGLYTVRGLTDKIKGLLLETEISDEYFTQILTVKDS